MRCGISGMDGNSKKWDWVGDMALVVLPLVTPVQTKILRPSFLSFLASPSRNLIDIPSTFQLERLEQQEAQNRSNEYMSALNTVKLPKQAIRKLYNMTSIKGSDEESGMVRSSTSSGNSIKAPSVREVLSEKTVDPKTIDWVRRDEETAWMWDGWRHFFVEAYTYLFTLIDGQRNGRAPPSDRVDRCGACGRPDRHSVSTIGPLRISGSFHHFTFIFSCSYSFFNYFLISILHRPFS